MLKRFLSFIVLVMLLIAAVAPVQAQEDPFSRVGDKTLTGTVSWYLGGDDPFYTDIANAFMKEYPGIKINVMATPWGEWTTRFQTLASAGKVPDVVWFVAGQPGLRLSIAPWADLLMDLSPFKKEIAPDDIVDPSLLDTATVNGKLLGLPYEYNNILLFYNKDLFDKAGVAYPNENWTWADLLTAGKKLTKPDGSQYGLVWNQFEDDIVLAGAGGRMFDATGSKSSVNSPEGKVAYEFLYDLYVKSAIAPTAASGISLDAGTAAMEINGNWMFGTYKGAGIKFGSTLIPAGPKGHVTVQRSNIWVVSKKAECMACALTFAHYLGFGNGLSQWAASGRLAPYKRFTVDTYLKPTGAQGTDYEAVFKELFANVQKNAQYAVSTPKLAPAVDNNDYGQIVIDQKHLLLVAKTQDIATTLTQLQAELDAYLLSKAK